MSDSFFERWSRRKQQVREGEVPPPEVPAPAAAPAVPAAAQSVVETETPEAPPPPTLADAEALTPESDFKPFVARNVAPEVRNAAMKKLFADPHFNVMDRMDVYIDDYSQTVPLPAAALRQMASAAFLNLVDDDEATKKKDLLETPPTESVQDVAQSEHPSPPTAQEDAQSASQETDDHHADLRLQQDDAARAEDPRHRAGS
ncbi:MAG TPA: DUF3306 domain-containing protein [Variovorax sp.]|nr:DUF3306 domain-containing protein [Variovorax sp.]